MPRDGGDRPAPADERLLTALTPLGRALRDYVRGAQGATLLVHVAGEPAEELPAAYFFRAPAEMGAVDRAALSLARGRVLDVGACAGAHALPLEERGQAVTALELIPDAVRILRERGLADVREGSVWSYRPGRRYDTVLALMNGTALAGTARRLHPLLVRLRQLTAADGQLLLDSTDLRGGPAAEDEEGDWEEGAELHYQLEYQGERGPPFPQLFVDERRLAEVALAAGWSSQVVEREGARYLARLEPRRKERRPAGTGDGTRPR